MGRGTRPTVPRSNASAACHCCVLGYRWSYDWGLSRYRVSSCDQCRLFPVLDVWDQWKLEGGAGLRWIAAAMSELGESAILVSLGVSLIGLAVYAFRLYRRVFRSNPERTMTRDVISLLFLGSWSLPIVLIAAALYLGVIILAFGLAVLWTWIG